MSRLKHLFRRARLDRELAGEIAAHIEEKAEELMESGMNPEEARRAARQQVGNAAALLEESREVWNFSTVETAWRDLRIGVRGLRRAPLFTAVAAAMLAVGIGGSAAIFSLVDRVLLRPLPFPDSNRIVMLWERPPKRLAATTPPRFRLRNPVSPANFWDWKERTHSFAAMAALSDMPMGLSGFGSPRSVQALQVSAEFFAVLGVSPMIGRTFTAAEDVPKAPPVAVLGYRLWQQQFGSDPSVAGRTVLLNDEPYRIVGVMPDGFDLPFARADVWVPIQLPRTSGNGRYLAVVARLKPGVPAAPAEADLQAVERYLAVERPAVNRDWSAGIVSLYDQTTADVRPALLLLFGAVTFVLLIAAGNVANLLLMRTTQRRREMAVRAALGAGRRRIILQLLAEGLVLSAIGGILGVALAAVGLRAVVATLAATVLPRIEGVQLDARVLAFSAALCLGATVLFGLAPAWSFSRTQPEETLREGGLRGTGRGRRLRGALVVLEVALSVVLLAGAGLLARSFRNQAEVDRGFRTDHILTMRMFFAPARYFDNGKRARYVTELLRRVRAVPGVEAASSAHFLPMLGSISGSGVRRLDRPEPAPGLMPSSEFLVVSPQYFTVMGIPLLGGRDFNEHDDLSVEPGVIVNQSFARKFFPGEDPIGKQLGLMWNIDRARIIGVALDARQSDLKIPPRPTVFLNHAQSPMYFAALVVRTSLPADAIAGAVQSAIHEVDPDQAISHVETMEQVESDALAQPRLASVLFGIFSGVALLLAAVGVYGVLAYSVSQRTREIGIRMALGANRWQLVRGVVGDGLRLIVPGMVVGLAAALTLTRLMQSLLFEISQADPVTFAAACGVLLGAGLLASWLPARRAAGMDALGALRWE